MKDSQTSTQVNAASAFLERTWHEERKCIAAGWLDCIGLHDAAYDHGVDGGMFVDPVCAHIFSYLLAVAELGLHPSIDACKQAAKVTRPRVLAWRTGSSGIDAFAQTALTEGSGCMPTWAMKPWMTLKNRQPS